MVQLKAQMQQVLIGQQQLQNQQITMAQSSNRQQSSARLPKLEIPSFNGEKLKWTEFGTRSMLQYTKIHQFLILKN